MDPNILEVDYQVLKQLETILENKSTRESFLKAVPPEYFNYVSVQLMDNESYKYCMTTARWLLFQLGNKGVRVSHMINWLEKQDIQKALILLKKDVPLQIIEQPPACIKVQKGSRLVIHCRATSYPPAEYQWFKGEKELLLQQDSELSISSMTEEDAGIYICLVSKFNLETGNVSWIYSNAVEVILEESFENQPLSENSCSSLISDITQISTKEIITSNSSHFLEQIMPRTYNIPVAITITKHPYVNGKISQGMSVCLHCKAESHYPVKYQWYKNGRALNEKKCQEKWKNLRDTYRRRKKRQPSGSSQDFLKPWPYFQAMSFLEQFIQRQETTSNLSMPEEYMEDSLTEGSFLQDLPECSNTSIVNMQGATSRKLTLNNLYPDLKTGDMKWVYVCEVSNDYEHVISNPAVVELANADITTPYFPSEKYAFMIANEKYDNLDELRKPAYDVADLAKCLESMKFKVFAYKNVTYMEMKNAFERFCAELKPNSYVLFYFAGHGFQQYGQMYLQPVDSSDDYRPQESICTEYILQCMQESNPAMNIFLIDACRKLPPQFRRESNVLTPPGEVFEGKMKNNTVYGFSTPFLYSSHESNSERNSFFVKYLKKYICQNKSIQDILLQVQRDFEGDPHCKGVQFPVIKTSLSGCRKLCDEIEANDESINDKIICLEDIKGDFVPKEFELPRINSSIMLEIYPHMDIFINGIDIIISVNISEMSPLIILKDLEVNLTFNMTEIQVLPINGVYLKDLDLKVGSGNQPFRNEILKKQVLGIQKIKDHKLNGKLCLKFSQLKMMIEREVSINIEKISEMKLSVGCPELLCYQTEDTEIFSCENNISFMMSQN